MRLSHRKNRKYNIARKSLKIILCNVMINEGLGKYLQTICVTFHRFPHFYALASLRLRTKDDGKKKRKENTVNCKLPQLTLKCYL